MDIKEITNAIMFNGVTNEQLNIIAEAVKYAKNQLSKQNKRSLRVGDAVKFTSNRNGMTYNGNVTKIAIKYVTVKTGNFLYKVPANMLEVI
jgi:ASC-1-like (ASCH) protein